MPKPCDGAHKSSTKYATVCARFSAKTDAWQWGFRVVVGERRIHQHPCRTEGEARAAAAELTLQQKHNALGLVSAYRPTLSELIRKYLGTLERMDRLAAARAFRLWLAEWLQDERLLEQEDWLDLLADRIHVDEVRKTRYQHLLDSPHVANLKPSSLKRYLATIRAGLNRAPEWFEELEQWRTPKVPHVKVDRRSAARTISDEEYLRLVEYLGNPARHDGEAGTTRKARLGLYWVFRALMLTGLRPGELYALKWSDVHLESAEPYLLVRANKTKHKKDSVRLIPITPELRAVIEAQRRFTFQRSNIFTNSKQPNRSQRRILKDACEACGIPYGANTENGLLLKFARHTTATRLLDEGFTVAEVADYLGNTPEVLSQHYRGKSRRTERAIGAAISSIEQGRLKRAS